jgi:GPH family glycoside/pentoside/hexuronide:cation symporter
MDARQETFEPKAYMPRVVTGHLEDAWPARAGLGWKTKALYGIGEISNSIKSYTFGLLLLFFYTSVLGLPGTLVGLATALSLLWDALIDPFIGYASDRARSRWGRRHPFMLLGAMGMGIGFFLVFNPPAGLAAGALFAWLVGTNLILRTSNSAFTVPYHALGAELTRDYHERTSVTGFRAAFAILGTLITAALSFAVFFPNTSPGVDPKFHRTGYSAMGLAFGLAMTLAGLIAALGTLSQRARVPVSSGTASSDEVGFLTGFALSLRNPSFLRITLSTSIFFLASVINATLAVHYLTYYARITASNSLSLFQASFYLGCLPGALAWMQIARRVDKHWIFVGATLALTLLMVAAYGLVGDGRLFGTGNAVPLVIGNWIAGLFASALWVVPASMIADVTDLDELRTGRRREGAFFGIHSFFLQESGSLAILMAGALLDHFAGLVPGQIEQSGETVRRIAILFGPLPAALLLIAALLVLQYDLTRQRVKMIQYELRGQRWSGGGNGD